MSYLLDTHLLLWAITEPERVPARVTRAITRKGSSVWFSAASYWEICIKQSLGKLRLVDDWPTIMERALTGNRIQCLPIQQAHCRALLDLEYHHRDPFDRMLVAQAISEDLVIATSDRRIARYPVELVL